MVRWNSCLCLHHQYICTKNHAVRLCAVEVRSPSQSLVQKCPAVLACRHLRRLSSTCFLQTQEEVLSRCNSRVHDIEYVLQIQCEEGKLDKALSLLSHVEKPLSSHTYLCMLKLCNKIDKAFDQSKKIHAHITVTNAKMSALLGDYLAMTLAKCGAIDEAYQTFVTLTSPTVFSWTAIISAYTDSGQPWKALNMFQQMQDNGVELNTYTFVTLFKACGNLSDLRLGRMLHAEARRRGLASHIYVGSTLVSMYGKCEAMSDAEEVFVNLPQRDPVTWNALLTAYVEQSQGKKALCLFRQMYKEGVIINRNTLVFSLQACGSVTDKVSSVLEPMNILSWQEIGQALHADIRKNQLASDVMVASALVTMYGKCGTIMEVDNVFTALSYRDIVLWNAMIAAYVEQGEELQSMFFYRQMREDGMCPDQPTIVMTLRACSSLAEKEVSILKDQPNKMIFLELGRALHIDANRLGFSSDVQVCNTLLSMYGKCGAVIEAEDVFSSLSKQDVVSWTVLLSTYVEQGYGEKAIELYKEMNAHNVTNDDVGFIATLQACSIGNLEICNELHFQIVSAGYDSITAIISALLIAYKNCASMVDAHAFFNGLPYATIVFWNACMAGYATEGDYVASLGMFESMKASGIQPDDLSFISVLSACRHTGLVGACLEYLKAMDIDHGLRPNTKHYGILLDLLGRAGNFNKVENMMENTFLQSDICIWLCLLGACGTHNRLDLAKQAFDNVMNLDPKHTGAYVLFSNVYAEAGMQGCAAEVEKWGEVQGASFVYGIEDHHHYVSIEGEC